MLLAEIQAADDVIAPAAATVIALLVGGALLWLIRTLSKFVTHVLPHFVPDPDRPESKTLPERIAATEQTCKDQTTRLDAHLVTEERQADAVAEAINGLRADIRVVHDRIDRVLGPGNPEVRR